MNAQAETDRAFRAAVKKEGDAVAWQRGGAPPFSLGVFLSSGTEPEAASLGATVTATVLLADFSGLLTAEALIGDLVTAGNNTYSVYRVEAFADNSAKCWLRRRG